MQGLIVDEGVSVRIFPNGVSPVSSYFGSKWTWNRAIVLYVENVDDDISIA